MLVEWDRRGTSYIFRTLDSFSAYSKAAVTALISPPEGAHLLSALGDLSGFVHDDLDVAPKTLFLPQWGSGNDIDYAGLQPLKIVRVGNAAGQLATSIDGGRTWTQYANAGTLSSGKLTYSANATSIIWAPGSAVYVAQNGGSFVASSGIPANALIEADKVKDNLVRISSDFVTGLSLISAHIRCMVQPMGCSMSPKMEV